MMHSLKMPYESIYTSIRSAFLRKHQVHAILLHGPELSMLSDMAMRLAACFLCTSLEPPCGVCQACQLLSKNLHPDCFLLETMAGASSIKIEQVRALNASLHLTATLEHHRVIIVSEAEKMTQSSANALLKSLEEPPRDVYFILLTTAKARVLKTILSRVQTWALIPHLLSSESYFKEGFYYPDDSSRGQFFLKRKNFLFDLNRLVRGETHRVLVAQKWCEESLEDILWFLYLVTAEMIRHDLGKVPETIWKDDEQSLCELFKCFDRFSLFEYQEKLYKLMDALHHTQGMNVKLILEDLLSFYSVSCHV